MDKDGMIEEGFATRIRREIASYQIMSGSLNVCCFYGAYETPKHLYLVTELCTGMRCHMSKSSVLKSGFCGISKRNTCFEASSVSSGE